MVQLSQMMKTMGKWCNYHRWWKR